MSVERSRTSAPSPPGRWRRRRRLWSVTAACAVVVLVEVAALTGVFGWVGSLLGSGSAGTSAPDLNPHHDLILSITGNVTYLGAVRDYLPALNETSLCGGRCPTTPVEWVSHDPRYPSEVGVYFFFNVTNEGGVTVNLSTPEIWVSSDPHLLSLQTYCCYSTHVQPYSELVVAPIQFIPGDTYGLEGYAFTTDPLPPVTGGGFELDVNFTSN